MPLPRTVVRLAGLPLLLTLLTLPAWAQIRSAPPLTATEAGLELTTLGQRLVLPPPDWVSTEMPETDLLSSFEAVFRSGDAEADLELYRKGAVYALSKAVYGAHVVSDPAAVPTTYRDVVLDGFSGACMPGLSAFVQLGDDPDDILAPLLLICGAQRANIGQGEVMVMNLQTSSAGLAIVYQQWRGPAFDPARTEAWPAPLDLIEARALQLAAGTMLTLAD